MNANPWLITLVIALEPVPILAGVLLLTTEHGRPNAIGFVLGWASALAVIGIATAIVGGRVTTSSGSTSSKVSAVLDIVLGAGALFYALRLRSRSAAGVAPPTPAWMARLDTMSPIAAFVLGAFLPPYLVAVGVGNELVREDLSTTQLVVAVILFVVIGSIGCLIPILVTVVRPSHSDAVLGAWRTWLQANWRVLMVWLLGGIGVYLAIKGVIELFQ
jgi:hypothetical protein